MSLIAITGRLPALSIVELESVFGSDAIKSIASSAVQIETDRDLRIFDQLGGTLKVARLIAEFDSADWHKVSNLAKKLLPEIAQSLPDSKISVGLSSYGVPVSSRIINATALEMKKILKQSGRSVRVVPSDDPALSTAKVFHNKLDRRNGLELLFIRSGGKTLLARTLWVQNIDAYASRDQARPMRDARVGMLPPKLAQTIINLSGFDCEKPLLDPFCGTGVILQEALIMGGQVIGSDLEPRMIEYSSKNLGWLADKYGTVKYDLAVADATSHKWSHEFSVIACETFLGRPLNSLPDEQTLNKIVQDVNTIHKKFLQNIARQTQKCFRMCIAVPAWKTKRGFRHLPVLDHLEELGYNRVSFVHANTSDLIYFREDQTVARELVVLIRK